MADPVTLDAGRREDGAALLRRLDEAGFGVVGAVWLRRGAAETWRLALFTPLVDSQGPRRAYEAVLAALTGAGEAGGVSVLDVLLGSPAEHDYRDLVDAAGGLPIGEAAPLQAELRGLGVDRAYVYRLGRPGAGQGRARRRAAPGRTAA